MGAAARATGTARKKGVDPAPQAQNSYQRAAIDAALAALPASSPVHGVVARPDVGGAIAAFEAADSHASAAQARYQTWNRWGLAATTFGVLAGALLLFPIEPWVEGAPRTFIGAVQTLALAVASIATLIIAWWRPLDEWRADRGRAEEARGRIFATLVKAPAPAGSNAPALASGKLDVVMAAYIDDQLRYFNKRAAEHRRLASSVSPPRLLAYLLVAVAFLLGAAATIQALGGALPEALRQILGWLAVPQASRWQLGITTVASGILAHATTATLMDEDERKAKLYEVTAAHLRALLARRLAEAKAAAGRGDEGPLRSLFAEARTILEREHAVWSFLRSPDAGLEAAPEPEPEVAPEPRPEVAPGATGRPAA